MPEPQTPAAPAAPAAKPSPPAKPEQPAGAPAGAGGELNLSLAPGQPGGPPAGGGEPGRPRARDFYGSAYDAFAKGERLSEQVLREIAQRTSTPFETVRERHGFFSHERAESLAETVRAAGGEAKLNELLNWARQEHALDAGARATIEAGLLSENARERLLAVEALKSRHALAASSGQITGGVGAPAGAQGEARPWDTEVEMARAQTDPRYSETSPKHDPEFRRQVDARTKVTAAAIEKMNQTTGRRRNAL